jgi:triacylglycerol esterase/lipase EstA (alpha/beta hydrolase family)
MSFACRARAAIAALVVIVAVPSAARAANPAYAPLDRPGPALGVPADKLAAALHCTAGVRDATVEPVLLNPATGVDDEHNYSWNWEPALDKLGIPWCAYTAPSRTLDDIQVSGEYLVYAIRTMYAMAGRRIAVMGHSQGGMSMRWALRFWPDTRAMVDDVIGFSGSNHGSTQAGGQCNLGCPPAVWQQAATAQFIAALNSYAETFPGISYTEIWTHTDEVVQPAGDAATASAALHTGHGAITNVAIQDICPTALSEHLMVGTSDPAAYALAVDALTHAGPADPARVDRSVCAQPSMPGVDWTNPKTLQQILEAQPGLAAVVVPGANVVGAPEVREEPALKCYVFAAGCPGAGTSSQTAGAGAPVSCASRRRFAVTVPPALRRAVVVTVDGRRVRVRRVHGRRQAVVDLRGAGRRTVVVRLRGVRANGRRTAVTRRFRTCTARA